MERDHRPAGSPARPGTAPAARVAPDPVAAGWSTAASVELALLAVAALAIRLVDLGSPPFIDELNHVLAALSLLRDGSLTILDGVVYERARAFTWLVAGFYAVFGQSLEVARLPAVISGVLLVCLLFAWLRSETGRIAAWTAALLLCFAPISIYLSQWVRFYTLHALIFWFAAWCVQRLVDRERPPRRPRVLAATGLLALLFAFHLQVITVVGAAGIGLFLALVLGPRSLASLASLRARLVAVTAVVAAAVAAVVALELLGVLEWLWRRATLVDAWAVHRADNVRFYHWLFTEQYGFLWALFPVAALLALASRWRLALLFLCVLAVGLAAHSVAAWKGERYVFYLYLAWFGVWGLAAGEALPWLWRRLEGAGRRVAAGVPPGARRGAIAGALLLAFAFAGTALPAYTTSRVIWIQERAWTAPPGHQGEPYRGHPDWERVAPRLAPLAREVDAVIGEPDLKAVHYLGDLDYLLYAGYLVRQARAAAPHVLAPEFTTRRKIGRPLISAPESVALIMACHGSGLVVAEEHVWGWRGGVPAATAAFIEQHAVPVGLPEETGILAYTWETPEPEASPRCEELRRVRLEAARRPGTTPRP